MTAASRKTTERQRRKDAGLVRVEVYVRPEDKQVIRDLADRLTAHIDVFSENQPSTRVGTAGDHESE